MKVTAHFAAKRPGSKEYSSDGWALTIEVEPPAEIQQDRDKLRSYVRSLFAECKARVAAELGETCAPVEVSHARHPRDRARHRPMRGPNGRANGNGSYASSKQLNYLRALANDCDLGYGGLQELAQREFGTTDVLHLTRKQASALIDRLRDNGQE